MKNLYFQKGLRYRLLVSDVQNASIDSFSEDPVIREAISQYLARSNFQSHYSRAWENPEGTFTCDVGSHSEFFIICDEIIIEEETEEFPYVLRLDTDYCGSWEEFPVMFGKELEDPYEIPQMVYDEFASAALDLSIDAMPDDEDDYEENDEAPIAFWAERVHVYWTLTPMTEHEKEFYDGKFITDFRNRKKVYE